MTRQEKYSSQLGTLKALLSKEACTAQDVMNRLKISKPTAYARIKNLQNELKEQIVVRVRRQGSKGPLAKCYLIESRELKT
jgi:predicted transcriptional regulator